MKLFRRMAALFLALMLLLAMAGCVEEPPVETTTEPETTVDTTQEDLTAKYLAALEAMPADTLALKVKTETDITVNGQSYGETGEMTLNYWNIGKEDFLAKVKQKVTFGDKIYEVEFQDIYGGGNMYQTYEDCQFYITMTAEQFMDLYVPAQLLDPALYTLSSNDEETVITFTDGAAGESWIVPEEGIVQSAQGTVTLDSTGALQATTYEVTYQQGAAQISHTYEVTVEDGGRQPTLPETTEGYTLLSNPGAAYVLEHAYGYLNQVRHVSSDSHSLMVSAAGGLSVVNNYDVDAYAVDGTYAARYQNNVSINSYATNENFEQKRDEKFIDGKYSISVDGGRAENNSAVTQQNFETAITNMLLENVVVGGCIAQAEATDLGSTILYEYTGTEDMALSYCADISETYFGDAEVLNKAASKYVTDTMEFYVALDKYSMLPTAIGIKYEGTHTIQRQKCPLTLQVDQSFDLASLDAYEAVTDGPSPDVEPEEKATPLFYHVTGADGQEMWLLGTIHVGDSRTAFLPQEIYDAFYSADALAIECDSDSFSEQVEEDEKLQEQIAESYYYTDGTTTKDHIKTEDLYEQALKVMKATGNYYFNSEQEKVYLWSNAIDNFFMRQGNALSSEKGVESRLVALAEEDDMPIREVESSLFQIQMITGFSENLQEVMLFSTLASTAEVNWESSWELYELWCQGDEAALTEEIAGSSWEFSEDDFTLEDLEGEDLEKAQAILGDLENINAELLLLQQEYDKAMSVDRNEGMLEVAKEYLESGDVVFYAVGLAHLLAENGLVNTLRQAGYTVELVQYQ